MRINSRMSHRFMILAQPLRMIQSIYKHKPKFLKIQTEVFRKPVSPPPSESILTHNSRDISPIPITPPHVKIIDSDPNKKQSNIRQTVQNPIKRKIDKPLRPNAPPPKKKSNTGEKRGPHPKWGESSKNKIKRYNLVPTKSSYDLWRL